MRQTHYSPPLSRFNVCALYHEAKARGIPMTQLDNDLVEAGLKESSGWNQAEEQMRLGGEGAGVPNEVTTHRN
jgi:hypothetical protein